MLTERLSDYSFSLFLARGRVARCISQYTRALLSARAHPLIYSVDGIDSIGLYGINGATRTMGRRDAKTRGSIRANDRPSRRNLLRFIMHRVIAPAATEGVDSMSMR